MASDFPDFDEKNFSILRYPPVLYLWFARVATAIAYQMQAVAVGWQIYEMTSSPMQLGFVGLMMFIPGVLLLLVVGHVVDRYNRRSIILCAQGVMAAAVALLAFTTAADTITPSLILGTVFMLGAARAFESTTIQTLPPGIVPPLVLPQTIAGLSSAYQAATIAGPALGGVLLIAGPSFVYATCAILFFVSSMFIALIRMRHVKLAREPVTLKTVFAGIDFVRKNPMVLGPMSLDMFAVIFGGATALLPIFARDIFEVGTWGLGVMRAAPAVGAVLVSIVLIRWPIRRHLGRVMYAGVAVFGLSTIVFGLSTSFPLSIFALMVIGGSDMLSVVIRQPLIQLETPDAMRGRVSAVNALFIGTSNQIGEFESGVTAAWFGTVPAVLIGGIGTLLIVTIWVKAFPMLYRFDTFEKHYKQ
ncbi:MAG TPA: MFS transporter [Xanthobacteraceae bacterium]|nr:MFS transporter [Xanthobacteraceae bacterium]